MLIDARTDDRAAEIGCGAPATMQMAQEVSKADCAVFDGGASQAAATLLQVRVDLVNAQARKALLVCAWSKGAQEPQRMRRAFGPRLRMQPTQISKPRVVVVYEIRGERLRARWLAGPRTGHVPCTRRSSILKGTGVSMAPFLKWRRLSVPLTEEPILSA